VKARLLWPVLLLVVNGLLLAGDSTLFCFSVVFSSPLAFPRMPRTMSGLLILSAWLLVSAILGARRAVAAGAPQRRVGWTMALAGAGSLAVGAAPGVVYYFHADTLWSRAVAFCDAARCAPTRAERLRLRHSADPLFASLGAAAEESYACDQVDKQLAALDKDGSCPDFPMDDAPCICGRDRWPASWTQHDPPACKHDYTSKDPYEKHLDFRASYECVSHEPR